jgi:SAM-dependent methyltransferase
MSESAEFGSAAQSLRALDLLYLDRPAATSVRPYFQFVADHVAAATCHLRSPTVLDIGCANGAFLHYLHQRMPRAVCTGIDALPELVAMARDGVPQAVFATGDIRVRETLPDGNFDAVTMLTLHSHFDDIDSWLDHLLQLVRPGGGAWIFGPFNPNGVDVLVRLRKSGQSEWLPGWNMLSRQTFEAALHARRLSWRFRTYVPGEPCNADDDDPLRTRAVNLNDEPVFTNGAGLILSFALLEITP